MDLKLKKSRLVNLSQDNQVLPDKLTQQVGGGGWTITTTVTVVASHPVITCGGGGGSGDTYTVGTSDWTVTLPAPPVITT